MPTETDKAADTISAKVDLLKVAKDILEHLHELNDDIAAHVLPPQAQSNLARMARDAAELLAPIVHELEAMPEDQFGQIPAEGSKAAPKKEEDQNHAKGHQSGQGVRGHQERRS
jgi:hypothetical protein